MIGKTISHYRILDKLGEGGMGVVYRAEDTDLQRTVALKFMPPELARDPDARKRFLQEARAASALDHPNICTIHEIQEAEGHTFIVMSYVDGESVKERIAAGPLPMETALEITIQIALGLAEAHEKRIIHRDIKPANIMLTSKGQAKIMDFGLATSAEMTRLTKAGGTVGTAAYMSPEQALGETVDLRSDIWSLGVVLYEMLTGKRPFKGDYEQAVLYSIINDPQEPVTGLRSGIPLDLERVIDKCLTKDASMRYQHVDELIADLRRLKDQSATAGARSSTKSRRGGGGRFRVAGIPGIPAIVGFVALLAIVGYLVMRELNRAHGPVSREPAIAQWDNSVAVLPFRDFSASRDQEYFCDGMTDALNSRLSRFTELKVIATTSVMRFKNTERDAKDIGAELGVSHIVEGTIQREADSIRVSAQLINAETGFHLWSDTYDEHVESIFAVQDKISMAIAGALQLQLSQQTRADTKENQPSSIEAYEYFMKGMHFIKSKYVLFFREEDFKSGVAMFQKAIEIDSSCALAHYGLAWAYEHHYEVSDDDTDAMNMKLATERAIELDPNSALSNACKGYYESAYNNDYDKAFQFCGRALEINPNLGDVNFLTGVCYLYLGLYEQGIPYLTKAIELDPYYFWAPYKLAMCYLGVGKFDEAAHYFEKYFELAPVVMMFPGRYVSLKIRAQEYDEVEALITKIEETRPDYELLPYVKALLLAARGKKDEALALYKNSEVYALLGMNDEAIESLNGEIRKTVTRPYIFYLDLLNNPFYEKVRGDARFKELARREKKLYDENVERYARL
jgi:serine/threonine protein kinase/Tfp pilus assembly protein PilF